MRHISFKKGVLLWFIFVWSTSGFFTYPLLAATGYWPTNGWRSSTPEEQGMDSQHLIKMLQLIRDHKYGVDSVTIIRNGYMVMDAYFYPFQKYTKHHLYNCTNSIVSMLVGVAINKGHIKSVDQSALEFFTERSVDNMDDRKRSVTLENLLTMSSGMPSTDSKLFGPYKMTGSMDWVQHALNLPMIKAPGMDFEYSSGNSHLLSAIIQKTTRTNALAFAKQHLFGPLGIVNVEWSADPNGITQGFGNLMLTPHDMAKLGLLYLNNGRWNETRVVSEDWIRASTQNHLAADPFYGYGYQWYVDSAGYFMAAGLFGQYIFVVPEKKMVVVFTSRLKEINFFLPKRLLEFHIIPAASFSQPLPAQPRYNKYMASLLADAARAPESGFIWISEKNGTAMNGKFIRKASPAFQFGYPASSRMEKTIHRNDIMSMRTARGRIFSASIREIPTGTATAHEDMITKILLDSIQSRGSDVRVISRKKSILKDGTSAFKTDVGWKLTGVTHKTRTLFVSAVKDGKLISLSYTFMPMDKKTISEDLKEGAIITESLKLE